MSSSHLNEGSDDEEYGPLPPAPKKPETSAPTTAQQQDDDDDDFGPPPPKAAANLKRTREESESSSSSIPTTSSSSTITTIKPQTKKQRTNEALAALYLDRLPSAQMYEWSFMHRDVVTHTLVTPETDFIITASQDGHVKFWKKSLFEIEFVKHFRAHIDVPVSDITCSKDGQLFVSCSQFDKTAKVFDVINFDMINVLKFDYAPRTCCLIHKKGSARALLAVSDGNKIHIYDPLATEMPQGMSKYKVLADQEEQQHQHQHHDDDEEKKTTRRVIDQDEEAHKSRTGKSGKSPEASSATSSAADGDDEGGITIAKPIKTLDKVHRSNIILMRYNEPFDIVVSCDDKGMMEYWLAKEPSFATLPLADEKEASAAAPRITFTMKTSTDLYEFIKKKTFPASLEFSKDGTKFVCTGYDKQVRLFDFCSGKLRRVYDETLDNATQMQKVALYKLENIDFGRRVAVEKDIEKQYEVANKNNGAILATNATTGAPKILASPPPSNAIFDESGLFVIYPTLHGIKIVNTIGNKVERLLGKVENTERFLGISIFQGAVKLKTNQLAKLQEKKKKASSGFTGAASLLQGEQQLSTSSTQTLATQAASQRNQLDPTIFCCAYRKNRFYLFTKREPEDMIDDGSDPTTKGRDVFNEKPSKEDMEQHKLLSSITNAVQQRLGRAAIIHTTVGDIHVRLFRDKCPKTVENFSVHSKNGYYNNLIFHRVMKNFMVQTGDPNGDGTGGASIWGHDFEDEFHPSLRHDKPFRVSMANAGPATNASQFFITTVATPWLDDKHTLFGEVFKGQEVVQAIENVRTNKENKPYEDISIINVEIIY